MEENKNKEAQLAIKICFNEYPLLSRLIKNQPDYLQSPWTQFISQQLHSQFGTSGDGAYYRIIFSPGTAGELMSIQKGPLTGLKTTSIVDNGKICSVAGLEKVEGQLSISLVPMLLTMGALRSIHSHLSYITDICIDIRNRQISGDKAKLERISEVIVDCFESMSEGDEKLNEANLHRVTLNTDDCFEILSTLLDDLKAQHHAKAMDSESVDEQIGVWFSHRTLPHPTSAIRDLMQHSVFAAYERYSAGRLCQVLLSGNYSKSNIERHKRALERVRDSIRKIFDERINRHEKGVEFFEKIINNLNLGCKEENWTLDAAQYSLDRQKLVIQELKIALHKLLDAKISEFDDVALIFKKRNFEIIVIDGAMIFSEEDSLALESEEASYTEEIIKNECNA